MKPKLLFLLIGLGFFNSYSYSQARKYWAMPDSTAHWNTYTHYYPLAKNSATLRIDGDTIYRGILYHKLRVIGFSYFPINSYDGAFRDDIINRKVYFLPKSDSVEKLLYDFNLQIGDTLRTYNTKGKISQIRVFSLDSILIGLNYRKRWILIGDNTDAEIIEGIGSSYGFSSMLMPIIEGHPHLTCFSEKNKSLYPIFDAEEGCPLISSVKTINKSLDFEIYPNPSFGAFTLISKENVLKIEIYSINGQKIDPIALDSKIEMTDYPKGVYYIKVSSNDFTRTKAIVIK